MQNNYFDSTHPLRPYTHSLPAMPGTFPPANALRGENAPTARPGFHPAENGGDWIEIEDHRGKEGYVNGEPYTVKDYGPLPAGWSDTPPPPTLEEARTAKIAEIDAETSAAILAGFDYAIDGQALHFSYDTNDQQNFADTANAATLAVMGVPGIPDHVTWNGWIPQPDGSRILHRLTLTPSAFLALYMEGALTHKGIQMEIGGRRKEAAMEAQSIEELEDI